MKAPDKIYIQTNAGEAFSSKWTIIPFRDFENTEYIRKDALLEWANKELSIRRDSGDSDFLPAIVVLDDLIDKLNEL